MKNPMEMSYNELDNLLDSFLLAEEFPIRIDYRSDQINYPRRNNFITFMKALWRLLQAFMFYAHYVNKKLAPLKKEKELYKSLKNTKCLRGLQVYFFIGKVGLTDLLNHIGSRFHDEIFLNFAIATMLYDASCDITSCRKYLKDFNDLIISKVPIEPKDEFLKLFNESVEYLRNTIGEKNFDIFWRYVQIEHISQLMSIYQLSDKNISKANLLKITFTKGGIAGLAVMHLMAPQMNKKQRKAMYELGAVMQLIDDIGDIKEDLKSGIQTIPNQKLLEYQELKQLYFGTVNNLITEFEIDTTRPNGTIVMLCWFADTLLEKRYSSYFEPK